MSFLAISVQDLIYYIMIIICLLIIAFILLKFWSIRKEEKEEIVVRKIEDPKPREPKIETSIKPTVKKETEENFTSDLEQVLEQMQNSLEQDKDVTQIFEQEQEEKAIISYQELIRANLKQDIKDNVDPLDVLEPIKTEENNIEKIDIEKIDIENIDIAKSIPTIDIEDEIPTLKESRQPTEKKFKQTGFISPIYGTMDVQNIPKKTPINEMKDLDIEKPLDLNGLSEEKKKNAEFLRSLKEFRNNL